MRRAVLGASLAAERAEQLRQLAARGQRVRDVLTAYCLRGLTRLGDPARPGVVAADGG